MSRPLGPALLVCAATLLVAPPWSSGADRFVLGRRLIVGERTTPTPRRRVVVSARETSGALPISGDPTLSGSWSGGLLQVVTEGGAPGSQVFALPQGTVANGRPLWRQLRNGGFAYVDRRLERGPVRSLVVRSGKGGGLRLRVTLEGAPDALGVAPPDPGTHAFVTLTMGDGDRYCVAFGPEAAVKRNDANTWSVGRAGARSCPTTLSGDFLALAYNVAGLPEGISSSHPAVNTPLIAPLLDGYDVVVMQETWKTPEDNPFAPLRVYHEILEAGAHHPYKSTSAINPAGTNPSRPSAILADGLNQFSRFPFVDQVRQPWTDCDNSAADCLAMKGFAFAPTTFAPGVTIDVYTLHMEAGGTPNDDLLRDQGITQMVAFITDFSAGRPFILGGDFNLHTDAEPDGSQFQRLLDETGASDVCATLGCPQPGRIDKWIFRSNDRITITPLSWRFETDVFQDPDGEPLSDHDALAVRFGWTAAED